MWIGVLHTQSRHLWIWYLPTFLWHSRNIYGIGSHVYKWSSHELIRQQATLNIARLKVSHPHGKVHWLFLFAKFTGPQNCKHKLIPNRLLYNFGCSKTLQHLASMDARTCAINGPATSTLRNYWEKNCLQIWTVIQHNLIIIRHVQQWTWKYYRWDIVR